MASDEEEDDFALLADDDPSRHHHQQQQQPIAPPFVSHRYGSPTSSSNPTAAAPDPQHFRPPPPSPSIHHNNTAAKVEDRSTKRPVGVGNGDELSDDGTSPYSSSSKKARRPNPNEYRKDREEWSDSAIACLLDAYTDKYMQLNRGNLRGRDWEEVAATVSHSHQNKKSVEQCKNKVDNLKKRYKAERQRITSGTLTTSHWPWFKKMEHIVSSSPSSSSSKPPIPDNDVKSAPPASTPGPGPGPITQPNRYMSSTPALSSLPNNMKLKSSNPRWQRVVLKISGSVFAGNGPHSVDPKVAMLIAREISMAVRLGVQVAVVVGGRNFFCGDTWVAATGVDRTTAYQIGMMATVMNAVLLQASLEKIGIQTRVQTAFMMQEIAEPYIRRRAIRHLEKGRVVIFGGVGAGPGNPLFTTDTAAALRASEISANAVLKGTNIDNGYGGQPRSCSTMSYENISYRESLSRGFSAMDMTAITFCEENNIPVVVFNLLEPGNISRALCGDQVGTLIDRPAGIS